jgi:hypothetical protein
MPASVEGESAVCRLYRLSERAGAGDKGVARNGGDSGGGTDPYEKDIDES